MISARRAEGGFALVTSLVFLVVLTMVAAVAIRSSGLELKMSTNLSQRSATFETSELGRLMISGGGTNGAPQTGGLLDAHVYNRGWPVSANGDVANDQFFETSTNQVLPNALKLRDTPCATSGVCTYTGATPANWYSANTETSTFASMGPYDMEGVITSNDGTKLLADLTFTETGGSSTNPSLIPYGDLIIYLAVYKLWTTLAPGSGTAMIAGYEGTGKAAAASGGNVFFYLQTRAKSASSGSGSYGIYDTSAAYRYLIRN